MHGGKKSQGRYTELLIPAATLVLDTGATTTILSPDLADDIHISPGEEADKYKVTLVGGKTIEMPFVTLPEIQIGGAIVKNLNVGIYTAFPEKPSVKGILGADFLMHYTMTIDRSTSRLKLVSQ
jgi:predicted aspartyl protease